MYLQDLKSPSLTSYCYFFSTHYIPAYFFSSLVRSVDVKVDILIFSFGEIKEANMVSAFQA